MKPLKSVEEAKALVGRQAKIIKDTSGHKLPIDTIVTLYAVGVNNNTILFYTKDNSKPLKTQEFNLLDITLETLQSELMELEEYYSIKKEDLNSKIKYMKLRDLELFDPDDYKVYYTRKLIEETKDELKKEELLKEFYSYKNH